METNKRFKKSSDLRSYRSRVAYYSSLYVDADFDMEAFPNTYSLGNPKTPIQLHLCRFILLHICWYYCGRFFFSSM